MPRGLPSTSFAAAASVPSTITSGVAKRMGLPAHYDYENHLWLEAIGFRVVRSLGRRGR